MRKIAIFVGDAFHWQVAYSVVIFIRVVKQACHANLLERLNSGVRHDKPMPEPIAVERLPELAAAVIRDDHFSYLATIDGA